MTVVVMSEIDASEVGMAVTVTTEVLMVVSRMVAVTVWFLMASASSGWMSKHVVVQGCTYASLHW